MSASFSVVALALMAQVAVGQTADFDVGGALSLYNSAASASTELMLPGERDRLKLQRGDVVSMRQTMQFEAGVEVQRVSAYVVVPAERTRVWVATLGSGERHASRLTEISISSDGEGGALWYQHLNLPWPFADRHWVIRTEKNLALAEETDDLVWEHRWALATNSTDHARELLQSVGTNAISSSDFDRSLYLTINKGGWVMMPLAADHTLVCVYATAELGGRMPDGIVARMTRKQLEKSLGDLGRRAGQAEVAFANSGVLHTGSGEIIQSLTAAQELESRQ